MMLFCFNDCFTKKCNSEGLIDLLSVSLTGYEKIKSKYSDYVDGIVTDKLPADIKLNEGGFSLAECVTKLSKDLQKIAYSNFTKYGVDEHFVIDNIDILLAKEYSISIGEEKFEALNAKIVHENSGVLFTLPVHEDLRSGELNIRCEQDEYFLVKNLFDDSTSVVYLTKLLEDDLKLRRGNFDKLVGLLGECSYNQRFKDNFDRLTSKTQNFFLKEVEYAIERREKTRFYPDDKLIKDVTPDKETKIKVFELRIFSPVAVRMYFYETPDRIYLGAIEGKPKKKVQTADIKNAGSTIKEFIAME